MSSSSSVCCVDLLGGSPEAVERMTELQERRRSLETLLNSRLAELRRVCLQEAELTGELPGDFPLEAGERRPNVRRRVGSYRHGPKTIIKTEVKEDLNITTQPDTFYPESRTPSSF
uniref:Cytohesin Ubiquitin Protein Inducing domain-containing protein n=1 Tax=Hucho hucho TaxID=62062 RepID=A0A4W5LG23_9TELE